MPHRSVFLHLALLGGKTGVWHDRLKWFTLFLLIALPAHALVVDAKLPDAAQEARAKALFAELRCVVCSGESVADSPADVAADMRRTVRQRIAAGASDDYIKQELVTLYGERVLMTPDFSRHAGLWLAPLLMLAALGLFGWRKLFRGAPDA